MDCSLVMAPSQHGPYLGILVASVSSVYLDWPRDTCHQMSCHEMMIERPDNISSYLLLVILSCGQMAYHMV